MPFFLVLRPQLSPSVGSASLTQTPRGSLGSSQHFQESKDAPDAERCHLRLFLYLLPFLRAADVLSCLECKTQQCFSSPPIWMVMSSSQGSCQRRQQPPGASHTTLLRCALVSVGSGLCRTRLRCFSVSSGITGLMQLEKLCFLYICVYVDVQNRCI